MIRVTVDLEGEITDSERDEARAIRMVVVDHCTQHLRAGDAYKIEGVKVVRWSFARASWLDIGLVGLLVMGLVCMMGDRPDSLLHAVACFSFVGGVKMLVKE